MKDTVKFEILALLTHRAPNFVSEVTVRARLPRIPEPELALALKELEDAGKIEMHLDAQEELKLPRRNYRLKAYQGVPIRETITIAGLPVPRLMSTSAAKFLPETFNEAVERLAEHSAALEERFAQQIQREQRKYWANVVTIFAVFTSVLALILTGLPKISTDPTLAFWQVVKMNTAQLLPIGVALLLFVALLRLLLR